MQYGATFSHRFAEEIGLNPVSALKQAIELRLDILRLCVYWDEVQPKKSEYDFSLLSSLLDICEAERQAVIITVGMKAPRWPEFYLPKWVQHGPDHPETERAVLEFVAETVKRLKRYDCIVAWQVENEPLDKSGPQKWRVPVELVKREVAAVRELDQRPIWGTAWGSDWRYHTSLPVLSQFCDVVGLDLYENFPIQIPFLGTVYRGSLDQPWFMAWLVRRSKKPVWIAELQAEPWEENNGYLHPKQRSMSPTRLRRHFLAARQLPIQGIMFWGLEYWLWRAAQGDASYISTVKELLSHK